MWNRVKGRYNSQCKRCAKESRQRITSTLSGRVRASVKKTRTRNKESTITEEDVYRLLEKQNGLCALSGVPLDTKINNPYTMSIDRIDPSKGYTPDNIQLLCWAVNKMKMDFSQEDFIKWTIAIARNLTKFHAYNE